jgi:predicted PilT family ATPase
MKQIFLLTLTFTFIIPVFSQENISANKKQNFSVNISTQKLIELARQQNGIVEFTDNGDTIIATKTWRVLRKNTSTNEEFTKDLNKKDEKNKISAKSIYTNNNNLSQIPIKDLIKIAQEQNGIIEITETGDTIITTKNWKIVKEHKKD